MRQQTLVVSVRKQWSASVQAIQVLINASLDGAGACYVGYQHGLKKLYLVNDSGGGLVPGDINVSQGFPLSSGTIVSNSQCSIQGASYDDVSSEELVLRVQVDFASGFTGRKLAYAALQTTDGANSDWQTIGLQTFVSQSQTPAWQPEQIVLSRAQSEQNISCARFPGTHFNHCAYQYQNTEIDLHEITSGDGGVSWSSPSPITSDAGYAEYDMFIAEDPYRGRLWLLYSRWGYPGNDLLLRHKDCPSCPWSEATTVIRDGGNHWDASILVLRNGDLLVLETVDGLGSQPYHPPKIFSVRSSDGGNSWTAPVSIYDGPSDEWFPVALQKSDGVIHLMFREGNQQAGTAQIGQLWSGDSGNTFTGHSIFSNSAVNKLFSYIGTQGGQNVTVQAAFQNAAGWQATHWQSWDNGATWDGPYTTSTVSNVADPRFTKGCLGSMFSFGANNTTLQLKRFNEATNACP